MALTSLNLDDSYPIADTYHDTNTSGTIRYVNSSDANGLSAMQRYSGDVTHRFVLLGRKLNELINAFNSNPYLKSFSNEGYVLTDGSHPFTLPVAGVAPTADEHLTPKSYVVGLLGNYQSQLSALSSSITELSARMPCVRKSAWTEHTWSAGSKQHIQFPLTPLASNIASFSLDNIVTISIVERILLEEGRYAYQQYCSGLSANFKIDALWMDTDSPDVLNVLIPNDVFYPSGYPETSGYSDITDPIATRELRATVMSILGDCDVIG